MRPVTIALAAVLLALASPAAAQREALSVGLGTPAALGGMVVGWFAGGVTTDALHLRGATRSGVIVTTTALGGAAAAALVARSLHPGDDPSYGRSFAGGAAGAAAGFGIGLLLNEIVMRRGGRGSVIRTFVIAALGTASGATIVTF